MVHQVLDVDGRYMDAHADLDPSGVSFHSRGGSLASKNARNSEYSAALRLILVRIANARIDLDGVWVDSGQVQNLSIAKRTVLRGPELDSDGSKAYALISKRMTKTGQEGGARGGNPTRKLRIQFASEVPVPVAEVLLKLARVNRDLRSRNRLSYDELYRVTAAHVFRAVEKLRQPGSRHKFGESTDFDLITDSGDRFPPKAVFGLAASEALRFEVLPKHFVGGEGTPCFSVLRMAGYNITRKNEKLPSVRIPISDEERQWAEGNPRFVTHLKRERASGLSRAKKDDVMAKLGRLSCERCGMDPVEVYAGIQGLACIEVHHHSVHVRDMSDNHQTTLDDLQCLCANCHRVVHKEMSLTLIAAKRASKVRVTLTDSQHRQRKS